MTKKWTKEEDQYLLNNYPTQSASEIAEKLNRSRESVVQRATGKLNIKKSGLPKNVTIDDLISKYKELQSLRKVGKALGIHKSKVGYYLKKAGLLNKPVRHTCNDNYFSQDTPGSFYWAGFIAADGCVKLKDKKYKQLSVGLATKDDGHVIKLKDTLCFSGPISRRTDKAGCKSSGICISSDQLFDDLARFNIVPRKSLIYTFPEWLIEHPLVNHFMRGYNDGDGSFYRSVGKNRTIEQLYFSVRGTKEFLSVFNAVLESNCEFEKHKEPRLNSGIYCLGFGGTRKVGMIRDFLYKDSETDTRLDRKYEVAFDDMFINIPENYREKKIIGINIKTGKELVLNSMKDGEQFGFVKQCISACCRGKSQYHKGYTWRYA